MPRDGKPPDRIDYEALQQEALRGVVRAALKQASSTGLPGDHHFYITFRSGAPGVTGPKELLDQYPDEMMIVLQHQFWDPSIDYRLRFAVPDPPPKPTALPPAPTKASKPKDSGDKDGEKPNIVSLDQFRKK